MLPTHCYSFLAWLFWSKKFRYCHDPGVIGVCVGIGVGVSVANFNLRYRSISVITEDIYLKLGIYASVQRATYTIQGEISQYIFLQELCS